MYIEKLPSGSYRVTVTMDKKRYRRTFDHKPTQKEVMNALSDEMREKPKKVGITLHDAGEQYIQMKNNVLSPKTVKEYKGMLKNLPAWLSQKQIDKITQIDINKLVNDMTVDKSPKTIHNYHGFIASILATFRPSFTLHTTLPQKIKSEPYIPSTEDIKNLMEELKDTPYELAFILACYGMRRSEICAATVSDLEGNILHITKALVIDSDNNLVVKKTKTSDSTRDIIIPSYVADKIRSQGYIYKGYPGSISKAIIKAQNRLGMPNFSLHKLRHFFASKLSEMGVPEADILALGGWKTDNVMKSVYRHSMLDKDQERKKNISDKLNAELF